MRQRWIVVKEMALEVRPGERPAFAYAVLPGSGSFPTQDLAQIALEGLARYIGTERGSLGWVVIPFSLLLPDLSADIE